MEKLNFLCGNDNLTDQILKRINVSSEIGSSWIFKRFNRLTVTFTPKQYDRD